VGPRLVGEVVSGLGYKFLRHGAVGPTTGVAWPQPSDDGPGAWMEAEGPLAMCQSGVHVLRLEDLAHWLHEELWLVEYAGETLPGIDCIVARRARLVRRIAAWQEGVADRFAVAARDHLVALAPQASAALRPVVDGIIGDASRHLPRHNVALAAFCAAVGVSKLADDARLGYRNERAWQSEWLVQHLARAL
jgi:hypothetical protein